jgi:type IV pilus assembly protein PilC
MKRYKYRAVNLTGHPVRGMLSATSEGDLYNQLAESGLELVTCSEVGGAKKSISFGRQKVELRDLIQFFIQLDQLQSAGVALLDSLEDVRDTSDNATLRDVISEVYRDVRDGVSLSEAMSRHPSVFNNLHISLIAAGEETGDLTAVYRQLIRYLEWTDVMRTKIKRATAQPKIAGGAVVLMAVVMLGYVVPQIVGFIANLDQELPWYTKALMATSSFFQDSWYYVVLGPIAAFFGLKIMVHISSAFAYLLDFIFINTPLFGDLVRKSSIARYMQTFGALYGSGVDIVSALKSSRQTVTNKVLLQALDLVEANVQAGSSLSESFEMSGEFPSLVIRMIKVGEGSGNLTPVLGKVSDFYTKDVDETVEGLIGLIQPTLTAIMGGLILWIAVSVFGPIYSSFQNMNF